LDGEFGTPIGIWQHFHIEYLLNEILFDAFPFYSAHYPERSNPKTYWRKDEGKRDLG
jgi:hypothetical protein